MFPFPIDAQDSSWESDAETWIIEKHVKSSWCHICYVAGVTQNCYLCSGAATANKSSSFINDKKILFKIFFKYEIESIYLRKIKEDGVTNILNYNQNWVASQVLICSCIVDKFSEINQPTRLKCYTKLHT